MASTISLPTFQRIGTSVPAIAEAVVDGLTAAKTDIEALQATTTASDWKNSCLVASDATIANLSSVSTADFDGTGQGVALTAGKRVLIRNNASPDGIIATHAKYQGIYVCGTPSGGNVALTRATDADTSDEVTSGLTVTVTAGTYAAKDFQLTTADPITLGTTGLTFTVVGLGTIPTPTAAAKILYDNGTSYVETAAGTAAQIPVINAGATAPVFVSVSGDATLAATGAVTVAKVNGTTVPAGGALTTGNAAYVSGAAATTYSALNLAGGAGWVSGVLPAANLPFQVSQVTLVAGTATVNAGITITAASRVIPVLVTPGAGASGTRYAISGLTVGGAGVGAFTITAKDSGAGDNTVNTDISVIDCIIIG